MRRTAFSIFMIVLSAVVLVGPTPSDAVDGQVLITQARAASGGVTPLDTPGFPVTISEPGSYKLASNLTPPPGVNAVEIVASAVTLDLNGFTIFGQGAGAVVHGVTNPGPASVARVKIRNGSVVSFGGKGVDLDLCNSCAVDAVVANLNADIGIHVSGAGGGQITNSTANFNGSGISLNGGLLKGNSANDNVTGFGLAVMGGLAIDNAAANNAGPGLQAGTNLGYGRNAFSGNNGAGAEVVGGVSLGHNLCNTVVC